MNQSDNQSILIEGVNEVAHDGTLADLAVQNTDAIKGGPNELINDFLASDKYVTAAGRALGGLTSK
jgi:hypothetical protein